MNIEKALKIDGWMAEQELEWLAEHASKYELIVEIGSYVGRSTRALADNTPGIVYAVDHWYGPADVSMPPWEREKLYDKFLANMNGLIESGKVIPVRCNSFTVELPIIPEMVFIDGDHQYESIKTDLTKWHNAPFLCGHDATWHEVRRALEEFDRPVSLIEGTDIWVCSM